MIPIRQLRTLTTSTCRRSYQSASQKLFADAEIEDNDKELAQTKERLEQRLMEAQNWTGDEKMEDTVLRMLVDKYKPLRGSMQTSDMKLKAKPPQVTPRTTDSNSLLENDDILSEMEDHKPWMTTYKTPSFAVNPSVKAMQLPPKATNKRSNPDETAQVKGPTREERLRIAEANRLASARDRTLDYRFGGIQGGATAESSEGTRANPKSLKGWAALAEERINEARSRGAFDNLKGFGKPIEKDPADNNPFIDAEEALLNSWVRRNGASPPWVELQHDLDSSVQTFRDILQTAWIRRAVRMLNQSGNYDPSYLATATPESLSLLRDVEWEQKERAYHEHAIAELNSQVRRYNGLAPYSVRRGLFTVESELARCYSNCGQHILDALKASPDSAVSSKYKTYSSGSSGQSSEAPTVWQQVVQAMRTLFGQ